MIELLKLMLDITGDDKDDILNHYLDKSQLAIKQYCNIEEIPENLNPIVVDLAIFFYRNWDKVGIKQATQGSRSQTLVDGIPQAIKACLPLPRLRVI